MVPPKVAPPAQAQVTFDKESLVSEIQQAVLKSLTPLLKQSVQPSPPVVPSTESESVQSIASLSVGNPVSSGSVEVTQSELEESCESVNVHRLQAVQAVSEELAPFLGLEVVDGARRSCPSSTLSLFPAHKPKKTTLFKIPPEFVERDRFHLSQRPKRSFVTQQSTQMFRLNEHDWAKISHIRKPDEILLSRTKNTSKPSKNRGQIYSLVDKD
jgi:hypothetical protein